MKFTILVAALMVPVAAVHAQDAPFTVAPDLFDLSDPDTLGLPRLEEAETITIVDPEDGDWAFNHGVVLMPSHFPPRGAGATTLPAGGGRTGKALSPI